jgi:AAA+ superfamily predicted ATPase
LVSAVAAASANDEIHIAPGIYSEPVVLDRPVRLTAAPGTVTIEARGAFSLHVLPSATGSSVSGVRFQAQDDHATVKVEAPACRFADCVIEASKVTGLWLVGIAEVSMEGCRISSAMGVAINVEGSQAMLASCELSAPGAVGISVSGAQLALDRCSFSGVGRNALHLVTGVEATVRRCTFADARTADFPSIFVGSQSGVTVDACEFDRVAADAIMCTDGARGSVEHCTFRTIGGNGVKVIGGATVNVRDLTAVDVAKSVVRVESGGRVDLVGATMSGRIGSALVLEKDAQGDVADLDVTGCGDAAIALIGAGARLVLSRTAIRQVRGNVMKVTNGASCQATDLLIECGEVDFPLVNIWAGSSVSIGSSVIRGGAEDAVHHTGSNLELTEVSFEGVGGHAVVAAGSRASVERCTVSTSGTGIEASGGCRLSVTATEVDGGEHGVVARTKAIVRVTDSTLRHSRRSGVLVEGAKAVLTSTRVEDSRGDGVMIGDESEVEFRGVEVRRSAGVGLRSTQPLTFEAAAVELQDNVKGDLEWPGRSARGVDRSVDELLEELELLVGLGNVKKKIRSLLNIIRLRQREADLGRTSEPVTLHAVFTGPPGTGKTTVARLYGELLHAMGFLDSGRFSEVTRADLVVGYIGQTASNVRQKFVASIGGVLFIDEAYSLAAQAGAANADFGEEAINELVPLMENHRQQIAVIAAGYTSEMEAFLDKNPGLRSRFAAVIEFPSYRNEELMEILQRSLARQDRRATPDAIAAAAEYFAALPRDRDFANAREVRRLLDAVVEAIANRVAASDDFSEEALSTVVEADVRFAAAELSA